MVQAFAARLRHIHTNQATIVVLRTIPKKTTKLGKPAVMFDMNDYMHTLTVDCKYTFVGTFNTTMPKVELISKRFIQQTQLCGWGQHSTLQCKTCVYLFTKRIRL